MLRAILALLSFAALTAAGNSFSLKEVDGPAAGQAVLLHGLGRSSRSMDRVAEALHIAGYAVCNVDYPSRDHLIAELVSEHVLPAIHTCGLDVGAPVDFVTHSMGGIIVREIAAGAAIPNIGRVVMLAPPNQGSEIVDVLGDNWLFEFVNGPAGRQLGTEAESKPNSLGAPKFELGIITGNSSINPLLSNIIPGDDDGKVAVQRAKVAGMQDFLILPVSHPFIMRDHVVIRQSLYFLANGKFDQR